ncbi:MAG TPA: hypothetical protein VF796_24000 [Humisphaera sp.]
MPTDADVNRPLDYAAPRSPQPAPPDPSQLQPADVIVMALLGVAGAVAVIAGTLMVLVTAVGGVGGAGLLVLFAAGLAASFVHCFVWVFAKPTEVRLPGGRWWHAGVIGFWAMFVVMQAIARMR